jgi:hypothetical protein
MVFEINPTVAFRIAHVTITFDNEDQVTGWVCAVMDDDQDLTAQVAEEIALHGLYATRDDAEIAAEDRSDPFDDEEPNNN